MQHTEARIVAKLQRSRLLAMTFSTPGTTRDWLNPRPALRIFFPRPMLGPGRMQPLDEGLLQLCPVASGRHAHRPQRCQGVGDETAGSEAGFVEYPVLDIATPAAFAAVPLPGAVSAETRFCVEQTLIYCTCAARSLSGGVKTSKVASALA